MIRYAFLSVIYFVLGAGVTIGAPLDDYTIQSLGSLTPESLSPYSYKSYALNNNGTVLGQFKVGSDSEASTWTNGAITPLGVFPAGSYSDGYAIDDNRDVVAELNDRFGDVFAGYMPAGGSWTSGLYASDTNYTSPRGMNSSDQFVGVATDTGFYSFPSHAFVHQPVNGNDTPILLTNSVGASSSAAFAISNNGYIVGNVASNENSPMAAVWTVSSSGTQESFRTIGLAGTSATDVNNAANPIVVGYSSTGAMEWVLSNGGVSSTLIYSGGVATGVNDSGVIVGDTSAITASTSSNSNAFVVFPGQSQAYNLNSLLLNNSGWTLYSASAVNNAGQIVGYGSEGGFLLTPVPVPEPTLGAIAICSLLILRRPSARRARPESPHPSSFIARRSSSSFPSPRLGRQSGE
jgi:hypothetical protein